ncbi:snRNA-activating protein of 50kDa MW C terminal-domain-containing protein [Cladochytrium replicatum]|nr:snRNA-activating protein of 50kDa MW C terminal-domain-containing protein [Cladochytrium replicatum]
MDEESTGDLAKNWVLRDMLEGVRGEKKSLPFPSETVHCMLPENLPTDVAFWPDHTHPLRSMDQKSWVNVPQEQKIASNLLIGHSIAQKKTDDPPKETGLSVILYRARYPSEVLATFLILASQTLMDLQNVIRCPTDVLFPDSLKVDNVIPPSSSYFFIEHVFYVDPRGEDTARPLVDWLKERKLETNAYAMDDQPLCSMQLQLQTTYLFVHNGDCEHRIVFTDARFLHTTDDPDLSKYPITVFSSISLSNPCRFCEKAFAQLAIFDHSELPENPTYGCKKCFDAFVEGAPDPNVVTYQIQRHRDNERA